MVLLCLLHQNGIRLACLHQGRWAVGAYVPPLLEGWKHKILLAGKYFNVIRECGIEISRARSHSEDEDLYMDDEKLVVKLIALFSQTAQPI